MKKTESPYSDPNKPNQEERQRSSSRRVSPPISASENNKVPSLKAASKPSALQGQIQKTSIEERVKLIQARQAKQKEASSPKEVFTNIIEQLRDFAITLIKGKPNISKTTKDFPINRNIVGRMKRYGPAKVYRLKGYTTVGRVKKKRNRDMLKKHRNRLIFTVILAVMLLVLFFALDPIPTIKQFLFDIGY